MIAWIDRLPVPVWTQKRVFAIICQVPVDVDMQSTGLEFLDCVGE